MFQNENRTIIKLNYRNLKEILEKSRINSATILIVKIHFNRPLKGPI